MNPAASVFSTNRTGLTLPIAATSPPAQDRSRQASSAESDAASMTSATSEYSTASTTSADHANTPRRPSLRSALKRLRSASPLSRFRASASRPASPAPVTEFMQWPVATPPMTPVVTLPAPMPILSPEMSPIAPPKVPPSPASTASSASRVTTPRFIAEPHFIGRISSTASHDSLAYSMTSSEGDPQTALTPPNNRNARPHQPFVARMDVRSTPPAVPPVMNVQSTLAAPSHAPMAAAAESVVAHSTRNEMTPAAAIERVDTHSVPALAPSSQSMDAADRVQSDTSSATAAASATPDSGTPQTQTQTPAPILPTMSHREFIDWARLSQRASAFGASVASVMRCPPICCGGTGEPN